MGSVLLCPNSRVGLNNHREVRTLFHSKIDFKKSRAIAPLLRQRLQFEELQADFLAGVWAHHAQRTKQILEQGDIEVAMNAAAVGDNAIQKKIAGHVTPDAFTHGTSEQRAYWFKRGFETGDLGIMNELFERDYDGL
jgi:predicted metalloprotease